MDSKKRGWVILVIGILVMIALGITPSISLSQVTKLSTQVLINDLSHPTAVSAKDFIEKVKLITGGRLDMSPLLPSGARCNTPEMLDAVSSGLLDVGISNGAYYSGKMPIGNVESGLTFSWRDGREAHTILYERGLLQLVRKEYAKHNVYLLAVLPSDPYVLYTTKKPVRSLKDLQGMKLRITGDAMYGFKKYGVAIVQVPYPDLYSAMQYGTIDGCLTILQNLKSLNYVDVVKYYHMPPIKMDALNVMINMGVWNKLPEDIKTALNVMGEMYGWRQGSVAVDAGMAGEDAASKKGVKRIDLPQEEFEKFRETCINESWGWAASLSPGSADAVKILKTYFKEIGRIK
jgi:TRAP-type C4-dicarboxylate transport system substrate-binding protein